MNRNFTILAVVIGFMFTMAYAVIKLMQGFSLFNLMPLLVILAPLMLSLVITKRSIWVGVMVALTAVTFTIPVFILDRLSMAHLFVAMVFVVVLAGETISGKGKGETVSGKGKDVFDSVGARCFLAAGALVLLRFLIDRPFSARTGGEGGGGAAVIYVLSFIAFWVASKVASDEWDFKKNIKIVFVSFLLFYLYILIKLKLQGSPRIGFHYFENKGWMLGAIIFSYILYRNKDRASVFHSNIWIYAGMAGMILVSLLSVHRRGIIFAIAIILFISYLYKKLKSNAVALIAMGVAGIIGLLAIGDAIPARIQRPLSVIMPTAITTADFRRAKRGVDIRMSGEVGWGSNFRGYLYRDAWRKIKKNPVLGDGFSFSYNEIISAVAAGLARKDLGVTYHLLTTGGYHNSVLAIAVMCGLPAGILALLGIVLLSTDFVKKSRKLTDPKLLFVCASFGGYFIGAVGMMLSNGSHPHFFNAALMMGVLNGIIHRDDFCKDIENRVSPLK